MRVAITIGIALFALTAMGQTRPSEPAPAPARRAPDFSERYGLLTDKNIFVRNRPPTRRGNRNNSVARPEAMNVVTGITLQEGRHVAFIENTGTRTTQRLLPGDSIAGGKIVAVSFDAVEFEMNGRRVHVRVGRNLLGDVAAAPAAPSTQPAPAQASGASPAEAGNAGPAATALPGDANLSPEERLKLRRQQQLGGGGNSGGGSNPGGGSSGR